jgi:5-methylcytosine-specific restriction endonuclease McrA
MKDKRPDLSEKARKQIGKKLKGHIVSKKTREKIRKKMLEQYKSGKRKRFSIWKGKKLSKRTKERMSLVRKGKKHWWGKKIGKSLKRIWENKSIDEKIKHSQNVKEALKKKYPNGRSGEIAGNWRDGLTEKNYSIRYKKGYKVWRKKVLKRDPICKRCKKRKSEQADHIKPVSKFPKLALVLSNGQGLCKICHKIKTREDYKNYIYK